MSTYDAAAWTVVNARGTTRDIWVHASGPTRPELGEWITPSGVDVDLALERVGPQEIDTEIYWVRQEGHRGRRATDLIWQTSVSSFKVVSEQLAEVLLAHGPGVEVFDIDCRFEVDPPGRTYVGLLEPMGADLPVHSYFGDRRSHRLVVAPVVRDALAGLDLVGLELEQANAPCPGDELVDLLDDWPSDLT